MIFQIALWVLTSIVAIPVATLLVQCVASWLPVRHRPAPAKSDFVGRCVVLMPAHDEESTLPGTLQRLISRDRDSMRIVVVADNCRDRTAEVAQQFGADLVIEREDASLRGKGHALAAGLEALRPDPPEVLIVLDADMKTTPADLQRLAEACAASKTPCQGISIMAPPSAASTRDQISSFAFSVKNHVRPLGMTKLGLPVMLTGTGMAFPWRLASQLDFASSNITEDMELASRLAQRGIFCRLVPDAVSWGQLPADTAAATSQRNRWEQGHLRSIALACPRLISSAILGLSLRRLAFALDLLVPPLSFLSLMILAVCVLHAGYLLAGLHAGSWPLAAALPVALACSILIAWGRLGPHRPRLSRLLVAPAYVAWKLPLYLAAAIRPEGRWVRTARPPAQDATVHQEEPPSENRRL